MTSEAAPPSAEEQRLARSFISAMSRLAAGVVMVTNRMEDEAWGLTISACCSVSASPPLVLVSLGESTTTARLTLEHGYFGVNLLSERSLSAAEAASVRGAPSSSPSTAARTRTSRAARRSSRTASPISSATWTGPSRWPIT